MITIADDFLTETHCDEILARDFDMDELCQDIDTIMMDPADVDPADIVATAINMGYERRTRILLADFLMGVPYRDLDLDVSHGLILDALEGGQISVMNLDDPREIRDIDEMLALSICGHPRHIFYIA